MHRIESLDIFGFKSFCEKTNLFFNGEITAIIGPNGCGKSNLSDAINWVIGEQSTKSLRADRMEDVIFNGTQHRKPLGLAEVTLTLRDLDTASSEDGAVIISRRLYRSGESEYFLNGRRCRLRDIHEFFEGTGLGAVSYALIEQGKIDMILGSKPQEKRALIEEAAKISVFKSKRKASEIKLELARQNLARVNDILHEVDRQLSALKRQAAKARRYYRLQDELKYFSQIKFWNDYRKLASDVKASQGQYDAIAQREKALSNRLQAAEGHKKHLLEEVTELEQRIEQGTREVSALQLEMARATNQYGYQEEQLRVSEIQLRETEAAREELLQRLSSVGSDAVRAREVLDLFNKETAQSEAEVAPLQEQLDEIAKRIESVEFGMQALRDSALSEVEKLATLRNQQARSREDRERIASQLTKLKAEREKILSELADLGRRKEEIERLGIENEQTAAQRQAHLAEEDRRADELKGREAEKEEELQAIHDEFNSLQHRLSTLEEMELKRANYSEGVQRFLNSSSDIKVSGTLADFVEADARFEAAIEDFLENQLQHIVVESFEDALKGIPHLKTLKAGRCTFLALHARNGKPSEPRPAERPIDDGIIGYLSDVLAMEPKVKDAFLRAFPELASAVLVAGLDVAVKLTAENPDVTFLTPSGEIVSGRGIISGFGERKSTVGFLSLKREKRELSGKIQSYRTKTELEKKALKEIKTEIERNAVCRQELAQQLHKLEVEQTGLRLQQRQMDLDFEKLSQTQETLRSEVSVRNDEAENLAREHDRIQAAIAAIESEGKLKSEKLNHMDAQLAALKTERDRMLNKLADLRLEIAAKSERKKSLADEIQRLLSYEEELKARDEKIQSEIKTLRVKTEELVKSNTEIKLKIDALALRKAYLEEDLNSGQHRLGEVKRQVRQSEEDLSFMRSQWQQTIEERSKVEVEKARLENDLSHLRRKCQESFHEELDHLVRSLTEEQLEYDAQRAEENYLRVKERLENFGAINMRALDEYRELEERYQFLLTQQKDIQDSILSTQEAIAEMNRRSIEQFKEAFSKINENFQQLFKSLFGGGHSEMRLLDETDLLESGVEIVAQPPGKKLQNVLLLSGGEKALTTLALLLAIFKYRPSPFCVLDEVDAPLDDANIHRFTRLIVEMSQDTQFILITHNKQTMEVAQYLYGVTMEEPGISKIVSVKFNESNRAVASGQ